MKRTLFFFSALLLCVLFVFPVHARAKKEIVSIQVGTLIGENGALVDLPLLLALEHGLICKKCLI